MDKQIETCVRNYINSMPEDSKLYYINKWLSNINGHEYDQYIYKVDDILQYFRKYDDMLITGHSFTFNDIDKKYRGSFTWRDTYCYFEANFLISIPNLNDFLENYIQDILDLMPNTVETIVYDRIGDIITG